MQWIALVVYAVGLCYLLMWVPFISRRVAINGVTLTRNDGYHWIMQSADSDFLTYHAPDYGRIALRAAAWTAFCGASFALATGHAR